MTPIDCKALRGSNGVHLVLGRRGAYLDLAVSELRGAIFPEVDFEEDMLPPAQAAAVGRVRVLPRFGESEHWRDVELRLCGEDQDGGLLGDASAGPTFLGTMSPSAIDCFHFHSAEDAQRRILFVRHPKETVGTVTEICRMDDEETHRFWAAYDAGIEHVSEILKTRGLW